MSCSTEEQSSSDSDSDDSLCSGEHNLWIQNVISLKHDKSWLGIFKTVDPGWRHSATEWRENVKSSWHFWKCVVSWWHNRQSQRYEMLQKEEWFWTWYIQNCVPMMNIDSSFGRHSGFKSVIRQSATKGMNIVTFVWHFWRCVVIFWQKRPPQLYVGETKGHMCDFDVVCTLVMQGRYWQKMVLNKTITTLCNISTPLSCRGIREDEEIYLDALSQLNCYLLKSATYHCVQGEIGTFGVERRYNVSVD